MGATAAGGCSATTGGAAAATSGVGTSSRSGGRRPVARSLDHRLAFGRSAAATTGGAAAATSAVGATTSQRWRRRPVARQPRPRAWACRVGAATTTGERQPRPRAWARRVRCAGGRPGRGATGAAVSVQAATTARCASDAGVDTSVAARLTARRGRARLRSAAANSASDVGAISGTAVAAGTTGACDTATAGCATSATGGGRGTAGGAICGDSAATMAADRDHWRA